MLNGSLLAMLGEFRSTAAIKGFDCFVTHPHLVLLFLFNFRVNVFYISFFPVPNGTGGSTVNQSERDFRPLFPFVNSSFYRSGRSKDLQVTPGQAQVTAMHRLAKVAARGLEMSFSFTRWVSFKMKSILLQQCGFKQNCGYDVMFPDVIPKQLAFND